MNRRRFFKQSCALGAACTGGLMLARWSAEAAAPPPERRPARGPLRVHPDNPRYFTDGSGRAVYLTGAHTWNNLVDMGPTDPPPAFDFDAYLDWLVRLNHNFIRLWTWELVQWDTSGTSPRLRKKHIHHVAPQPWLRTGPGQALDGKPKFDLTRFNPEYFRRLRQRVEAAGRRGIYVSIMLFEGWGVQFVPRGWRAHPMHPDNNINGIQGDANGDGRGVEIHTLVNPAITRLQEAYVRQVVDTVGELDNVLYEISNENHPPSTEWQYHMIRYVRQYERRRGKEHPIGMTFQYRGGSNRTLMESPADWISPNHEGGYRNDPPPADGRKVVLSDTDHLWGVGGNQAWVWKTFLRGHNPLFMDPYDGLVLGKRFDPAWDPIRRSLGYTLRLARRMNLAAMTPRKDLASSGYCLATRRGVPPELLVYLPTAGSVTLDLSGLRGPLKTEWFDPNKDQTRPSLPVEAGGRVELESPFDHDAVVYLRSDQPA